MANEQYGFYVDTSRCVICWGCEIACKQWNSIKAGGHSRRKVEITTEGVFPNTKRIFTSLSCMHCENPSCVAFCPEGAVTKRDEDGLVVIDKELCTGCGTCRTNCPFEVPDIIQIEENGTMRPVADKCDACLSLGRQPDEVTHCVATCPLDALHFGILSDMEALAKEKGGTLKEGVTGPSVYIS